MYECAICLDRFTDPVVLRCGHTFDRICIDKVVNDKCPKCRGDTREYVRNYTLIEVMGLDVPPEPTKSSEPDSISPMAEEEPATHESRSVCDLLVKARLLHRLAGLGEGPGKMIPGVLECIEEELEDDWENVPQRDFNEIMVLLSSKMELIVGHYTEVEFKLKLGDKIYDRRELNHIWKVFVQELFKNHLDVYIKRDIFTYDELFTEVRNASETKPRAHKYKPERIEPRETKSSCCMM